MSALYGVSQYESKRQRLLDFNQFVKIGRKYQGKPIADVYSAMVGDIRALYGRHILPQALDRSSCFFMNAGGWMGQTCILHASMFEYAIVFIAGIETQGHSGRLWVNVSDFVGNGWLQEWREGSLAPKNFSTGSVALHEPFVVNGVRSGEGTWALEYGHGMVLTTLPHVCADTLFSTHDVPMLVRMLLLTFYSTLREMWYTVDELMTGIHNL